MRLYPESASVQLEFDKVRHLLVEQTRTAYGREKAEQLRIHTKLQYIETELRQSYQYFQLLSSGTSFSHEHAFKSEKELKLLSIQGAVLTGDVFLEFRRLAENIQSIFRWFDDECRAAYNSLFDVISITHFEKKLLKTSARLLMILAW